MKVLSREGAVWARQEHGLTAISPAILKFLMVVHFIFWNFFLQSQLVFLSSLASVAVTILFFCGQEHFGVGKSKDFQLFSSPHGKNLLFKDSALGFLRIPPQMDSKLYLGYRYMTSVRNLQEGICKYSERTRLAQKPDKGRDERVFVGS
jgi:hypothetical protein